MPTYGVADNHSIQETLAADSTAQTPLLHRSGDGESLLSRSLYDGKAGLVSCVGNLANTILGTGVLAFPLAMASCGLIPGAISCALCGGISAFALYLLSRCATETPKRRASFFAVAKLTYPSLAIFFDAAIAIKCFGVSVSYLIIVKGLMPSVVRTLHHVAGTELPLPWYLTSGRFWITSSAVILVPLCFLRKLDSLRHTSYVALFSVAYLMVIVIVCHFKPPKGMPNPGEWHWVRLTPSFVSTFPVQVFAFTCAQNLFPIYNELASNTQRRMNIAIGASLGGATVVYEIISIFGYITFGMSVGPNIIAMYPSTTLFVALGQFAIVVLVLFSYPLQVHPCRNCLDKVFASTDFATGKVITQLEDEDDDDEDGATIETELLHGGGADMTPMKHTLLTSGIVVFGFLIAYIIDDLQLVLSFVGSTGSTTISFILPGLFYFKLFGTRAGHSPVLKWGSALLFVYGILIFIFCLTYNIWSVIHTGPQGMP